MFGDFLRSRKAAKAARAWRESSLGRALADHTDQSFTTNARLASLSEETKSGIADDFYRLVFRILQADKPFLAMRENLAAYV
jgi:hypothetical protein